MSYSNEYFKKLLHQIQVFQFVLDCMISLFFEASFGLTQILDKHPDFIDLDYYKNVKITY